MMHEYLGKTYIDTGRQATRNEPFGQVLRFPDGEILHVEPGMGQDYEIGTTVLKPQRCIGYYCPRKCGWSSPTVQSHEEGRRLQAEHLASAHGHEDQDGGA